MTTETMEPIEKALYPSHDIYSNLVYLIDKDEKELIRQYHQIRTEKTIIAAYSINGRHCLVLFVDGKVKQIKKDKKGIKYGNIN